MLMFSITSEAENIVSVHDTVCMYVCKCNLQIFFLITAALDERSVDHQIQSDSNSMHKQ